MLWDQDNDISGQNQGGGAWVNTTELPPPKFILLTHKSEKNVDFPFCLFLGMNTRKNTTHHRRWMKYPSTAIKSRESRQWETGKDLVLQAMEMPFIQALMHRKLPQGRTNRITHITGSAQDHPKSDTSFARRTGISKRRFLSPQKQIFRLNGNIC